MGMCGRSELEEALGKLESARRVADAERDRRYQAERRVDMLEGLVRGFCAPPHELFMQGYQAGQDDDGSQAAAVLRLMREAVTARGERRSTMCAACGAVAVTDPEERIPLGSSPVYACVACGRRMVWWQPRDPHAPLGAIREELGEALEARWTPPDVPGGSGSGVH